MTGHTPHAFIVVMNVLIRLALATGEAYGSVFHMLSHQAILLLVSSATSSLPQSLSIVQRLQLLRLVFNPCKSAFGRVRMILTLYSWNEWKIVTSLAPHPSIIDFYSFVVADSYALVTM